MSSEKNYLNNNYKSFFEDSLSVTDPELYKAITDELKRQQELDYIRKVFQIKSI